MRGKSGVLALGLLAAVIAFAMPRAGFAQDRCDKLRQAAADAQKEVDTARASGDKAKLSGAMAKYEAALAAWRACRNPPPPAASPTTGSTGGDCDGKKSKFEKSQKALHDAAFGSEKADLKGLQKDAEADRKSYCQCLRDKGTNPLPKYCGDFEPVPPPRPVSIARKKSSWDCMEFEFDYYEARWELTDAAIKGEGADLGKLRKDVENRLEDWCACLDDMGYDPLPSECYDLLAAWRERAKKSIPPPPPPSKTAVAPPAPPPPSKTSAPAPPSPPPPSKTSAPPPPPPPPPPPSGASAPPSSSSTYICGKSPCDCAKQSPPKVCKAGSGCVCTKG